MINIFLRPKSAPPPHSCLRSAAPLRRCLPLSVVGTLLGLPQRNLRPNSSRSAATATPARVRSGAEARPARTRCGLRHSRQLKQQRQTKAKRTSGPKEKQEKQATSPEVAETEARS